MEDRPTTIRVYPGELRPVYYTSVLASPTTTTLEVYVVCLLPKDCSKHEAYIMCRGTSDKGPSEIGTTSLQRTLVAAPC